MKEVSLQNLGPLGAGRSLPIESWSGNFHSRPAALGYSRMALLLTSSGALSKLLYPSDLQLVLAVKWGQ